MSIFMTRPEAVDLEAVRHDYARAFANDPDDIDLRAWRFDQWLAEHDRRIAEQAWADGWEEGQYYAVSGEGRTKEQAQAKDLRDNPYLKENRK